MREKKINKNNLNEENKRARKNLEDRNRKKNDCIKKRKETIKKKWRKKKGSKYELGKMLTNEKKMAYLK